MKDFYWWVGWKLMSMARWFFARSPGGCCVFCGRKVGMNSVVWNGIFTCWPCHDVYKPLQDAHAALRAALGEAGKKEE